MKKEVIILGSSGSVGQKAFSLALKAGHRIKALVGGKNKELLLEQSLISSPDFLVLQDYQVFQEIREKLRGTRTQVLFGLEGSLEILSQASSLVISAVPGIIGLELTLAAVKTTQHLAIANKEALVYAGEKLLELAALHKTKILPLDSEHYALSLLLTNQDSNLVRKLIITASGGPLWNLSPSERHEASLSQVLNHPTWKMGPKITVDSATLANKAIEIIEAHYLFDFPLNKIEALVQRTSTVHAMIELHDGSFLMEVSQADMAFPLAAALAYPQPSHFYKSLDLTKLNLSFQPIDTKAFPIFALFLEEAKKGLLETILVNYANELVVGEFLAQKIPFADIYPAIEKILNLTKTRSFPLSQAHYLEDLRSIFQEVEGLFFNFL